MLAGSLALHAAAVIVLMLRWTGREMPEPQSPAPAVAMVFESPGGQATAPMPPKPETTVPQGEESATPEAAPPPPPPPPSPMSEAAPPTPAPAAPAEPAPPQPAPTPPASQATNTPPQVNLDDVPMPLEQEPEAEAVPPPAQPTPEPPRPAPQRNASRSAARPSRARPASRSSPFSAPMELSFAPTQPARRRHGTPTSRGLDLAMGPMVRDGKLLDPVSHLNAPGATADWRNAVSAWIAAHKYYPEQAAEQGEDGTSVIRAVIGRDGLVHSVRLLNRSGSQWLDMATLAIFRGQHLPPFPDDMPGGDVTVDLEMNYVLVR
ncbi:MAG TPA: energy transducer TonB [Acetobacteraceae bacterium]|nr:energy transducer TonB [Acetobacteraceae bacterium]